MQHRNGKPNRNQKRCTPDMKNIYEVLRQKEQEVQQLQRDIEALRVAARLLADDNEAEAATARPNVAAPRVSAAAAVAAAVKPAESLSTAAGIRQFP